DLATIEHRNDVRMSEPRDDARLALEASLRARQTGVAVVQPLEGDALSQALVDRLVDEPHPAATDHPAEAIRANDAACLRRLPLEHADAATLRRKKRTC